MILEMLIVRAKKALIARIYGKIHTCPECHGMLRHCDYCNGEGKVTSHELDMYHDDVQRLLRKIKKQRGL